MPKIGVFSGREICQIMKKYGYLEDRQRGSHILMRRKMPGDSQTVPVPDKPAVKIGTLMAIIRQSGIPRSEFEK